MTEKHKEELEAAGVALILALLLSWLMAIIFGRGGSGSTGPEVGGVSVGGSTGPTTGGDSFTISPYVPIGSGGGCGCGCNGSGASGCSISPDTIGTINQIIANGISGLNSIEAAGNSTLQAIADYYTSADPLLQVTVG